MSKTELLYPEEADKFKKTKVYTVLLDTSMRYIKGISQAYLRLISGIYQVNLRYISGKYQAYFRKI